MSFLTVVALLPVLIVVVFFIARSIHQAFYEFVPGSLLWRAPITAMIIWLLTILLPWSVNTYRGSLTWPISWNQIFFSPLSLDASSLEFAEIRLERDDGVELIYYRQREFMGVMVHTSYRDGTGRTMPSGVLGFIGVTEDGTRVKFETILDAQGNIDHGKDGTKETRYRAEDGRIMTESEFGRLSSNARYTQWVMFLTILLNMICWILGLWLLCQTQFSHAFYSSLPVCLIWLFVLNTFAPGS